MPYVVGICTDVLDREYWPDLHFEGHAELAAIAEAGRRIHLAGFGRDVSVSKPVGLHPWFYTVDEAR